MLEIKVQNRFKKDIAKLKKQNKNFEKLKLIIDRLIQETALPPQCKDHPLKGNYSGTRECHIEPDFLLIYSINPPFLELIRAGSHSELF